MPFSDRIMLIDDDEELLDVLKEIFSVYYECKSFLDANEALAEIRSGVSYDCMVCDLMMPKMSGIEFYAAVRNSQPTWLSRILFMTGGSDSKQMNEFLNRPEINYCEKPIQVKAILILVNDLIQKKNRPTRI